jgi:hypothetical protein
MDKYPRSRYRERLREVRRIQGWNLGKPVVVRGATAILAMLIVGAWLGRDSVQSILGAAVGVVLGLGYVWMEVRVTAGYHVWRADQANIDDLRPKAEQAGRRVASSEDLTLGKLQALACPIGNTSRTAADFLVECYDLMYRGAGTEDLLAQHFSGTNGVSLGSRADRARKDFQRFLVDIMKLRVIERTSQTDIRYGVTADLGQAIWLRLTAERE